MSTQSPAFQSEIRIPQIVAFHMPFIGTNVTDELLGLEGAHSGFTRANAKSARVQAVIEGNKNRVFARLAPKTAGARCGWPDNRICNL